MYTGIVKNDMIWLSPTPVSLVTFKIQETDTLNLLA